jgi:hypothetical protein
MAKGVLQGMEDRQSRALLPFMRGDDSAAALGAPWLYNRHLLARSINGKSLGPECRGFNTPGSIDR